jgi:hypothetical protein
MRVAFLPTITVSTPLTVLLIVTLNILLAQFSAAPPACQAGCGHVVAVEIALLPS